MKCHTRGDSRAEAWLPARLGVSGRHGPGAKPVTERRLELSQPWYGRVLEQRTLLGAPGIATRSKERY